MPQLSPHPPLDVSWGLVARESRCGDGTWVPLGASLERLPRSQWVPVSLRYLIWHIFSQLDGHCASNAAVVALMALREMAGLPRIELAPESLYMQHSVWGTGSTLEENLRYLSQVGVLPRSEFPKNMTPRGTKQLSAAQRESAKRYRVLEWFDLDGDFELLCTAMQHGFVCVIGLRWPGGGGHSVVATDLKKDNNRWLVGGPNSWGESWGDEGFYVLSESDLRSGPGYGSWAARACIIPEL